MNRVEGQVIQIYNSLCLHYVIDRFKDSAAMLVSINTLLVCAHDCVNGGLSSVRVLYMFAKLVNGLLDNSFVPLLIILQSRVFDKQSRLLDSKTLTNLLQLVFTGFLGSFGASI